MEVKIGVFECDLSAEKKSFLVKNISDSMREHFANRFYGDEVECIVVSIIILKMLPGYEEWHKPRRPRFIEHKIVKGLVNNDIEVRKTFYIEGRLDNDTYDLFVKSSDDTSLKILASEIMKMLPLVDALPKRIKDFDREQFKKDLESFFHTQVLLEK
jgi:hypothetical protein